tara:strand:- start:648 stop:2237 length:1590 start_codon:yes stop_codon:yes gene_type:complete
MEYLTTSQIADFNNPMAFARTRTTRVGQTEIGSANQRTVRTGDIEESYRLVLGATEKLEILSGNLNTMLDLTNSGMRNLSNSRKQEEIYGKLRSLSAGFNQVVEAIRFDGESIFTNKPIALTQGPGTRDLLIDPVSLLTHGENSLELSLSVAGASVGVEYYTDDAILNDAYDVVGLELNQASYLPGSNPALELETGSYKVAITYLGENSSVEIRNTEGGLIEKKDQVDLSGSGSEWVDFDVGVRLNFEMESLFQSFDKYDFEAKGAAVLSATLNYERVDKHVLRTASEEPAVNSAEFVFSSPLTIGSSQLKVGNPQIAPLEELTQPLATGNYTVEVEYYGENSIVKLSDELGRLQGYQFGVDLSQDGIHEVNFGNGLSFEVETDQFNTEGASLTTALRYNREAQDLEEFDFSEYADRIREALLIVNEQLLVMGEAKTRIEETNQLRNSANTSNAPSAAAFNAASANLLLSGGGGGGLFGAISSGARFGVLSTQLFETTVAFQSQANQSPQELAQLSIQGNAASVLSTFA